MDIKRTCSIVLEPTHDGLARMRYHIRWDGSRSIVAVNIPYLVDPSRWEPSTQTCRKNTWHGKDGKIPSRRVNAEIARYEEAIDDTFASFEAEGRMPEKEEFRERLQVRLGKKTSVPVVTMAQVIREFVEEESRVRSWSASMESAYISLSRNLEQFKKGLKIEEMDERGQDALLRYWTDDPMYKASTMEKYASMLKRLFKWSQAKGYVKSDFPTEFNPKFKKVERPVIFLEWDELMRVYGWEFDAKEVRMREVRDIFCFCCFTGLRYSDVKNLRKSDVGPKGIRVTTIKTRDTLLIEFNKYSRAILDRYMDRASLNGQLFPVPASRRMNLILRDIMERCKIDSDVHLTYYIGRERHDEIKPKHELVTTHVGRKTFVCNALMRGIPADIVMKWTGHSDYAAMKPYIAIADAVKAEAMKKFDE